MLPVHPRGGPLADQSAKEHRDGIEPSADPVARNVEGTGHQPADRERRRDRQGESPGRMQPGSGRFHEEKLRRVEGLAKEVDQKASGRIMAYPRYASAATVKIAVR